VGAPQPLADAAPADWTGALFAFASNGTVYLATGSGVLLAKPVTSGGLGAGTVVDPYDDPVWSSVRTGFPDGQTYRGTPTRWVGDQAQYLTSAFVDGGRLYGWLWGSDQLHWRSFETDTGIVGSEVHDLAHATDGGAPLGVDQQAFVAGGRLFHIDADGNLRAMPWADGTADPTADTLLSGPGVDGVDWRGSGRVFVLPAA